MNLKEKGTRSARCRAHVDKRWNRNDAFEREVARTTLLRYGGCAITAKYSVNPAMLDTDCDLVYLDLDVADKATTFCEELNQYRLGFDIMLITSLEENIPSHPLQPFV